MKGKLTRWAAGILPAMVLWGAAARAEEPAPAMPALAVPVSASPAADGSAPADVAADPGARPRKSRPPTKGKRIREKEAEGSQAPNRFEADTVIKSKYEHNGQPLEVDPD